MSYMRPTHEESGYVQVRASSLGYGALGPGCSSMTVVGNVADQQFGQIVGYMRQQGMQATIHNVVFEGSLLTKIRLVLKIKN
ncbi:hypothetical protein AFCA_006450 [Aspergillus flavus]|nr:hypothetical protein AFCA_006450 [Aspergillus flavus]